MTDDFNLSTVHTKFGVEYSDESASYGEKEVRFPYFPKQDKLNLLISRLLDSCPEQKSTVVVKFVFADERFIVLSVNGYFFLNFCIEEEVFLPPFFVMKMQSIGKRQVEKFAKKVCRGKVLYETLRIAPNGIRVNLLDKKSKELVTVKVVSKKKMHK